MSHPDSSSDDIVEVLVHDEQEQCPYLPERTARMPLRLPTTRLSRSRFDACLQQGDRRSGPFLYRTQCPSCSSCQPLRLEVDDFIPSRTQQRVHRRGDREFTVELGDVIVDQPRVDLYNAHRRGRGLDKTGNDIDMGNYESFLAQSCCDSFEIRYRVCQQLVAVAVCDQGESSISAVYCYFDPQFSHLSPGTYSILKQIELCQAWDRKHLYLGLYIAECSHMAYKSRYLPHQRLIEGSWRRFER